MKKTILNTLCLSAFALVVAHCGGGDDSTGSAGAAGTATSGTGGSSTGAGGASTGAGGSAATGPDGSVSTGAGGTASTGAGGASTGAGGATGAGGTGAGGTPNNSFCPATEPTPGDPCTPPLADAGAAANMCLYTVTRDAGPNMVNCGCRPAGARNDAGIRADQWACAGVIVRPDAGGGGAPPPVDAGLMDMCPANNVPNAGNCAPFVTGLVCPGNGGRTCTCRAAGGGGGGKAWNCPAVMADAATGG
jgi:collagen type I/II/III/V/XI/XXIV/XXVII alpha